ARMVGSKAWRSAPRLRRWTLKISPRSSSEGMSRKKIWSKRPLRMTSAGSRSMRFAVAATNTGAVFSCLQVRKVEKMRQVEPARHQVGDLVALGAEQLLALHQPVLEVDETADIVHPHRLGHELEDPLLARQARLLLEQAGDRARVERPPGEHLGQHVARLVER